MRQHPGDPCSNGSRAGEARAPSPACLAEIGDILAIRRGGLPPCQHVLSLLDTRIAELDPTIRDLRQLRRTLADTRAHAAAQPPDPEHTVCQIIQRPRATSR